MTTRWMVQEPAAILGGRHEFVMGRIMAGVMGQLMGRPDSICRADAQILDRRCVGSQAVEAVEWIIMDKRKS